MYREGKLYVTEPIKVFDHDFPHLAECMAIPRGIYDLSKNVGYVMVGSSHDTSEFVCDSIFWWWDQFGKKNYPKASSILLLCDAGGSNSYRHYIFKQYLQDLVERIQVEIRVCHLPLYTSKYNPIEHNLFPHISRACRGVILESIDMFCDLVKTTSTKTGLKVFVSANSKYYEPGLKFSEEFKKKMPIIFDAYLPDWNYTAVPKEKRISPFYSLAAIRDKTFETKESLSRTLETVKSILSDLGESASDKNGKS